MKRIGEPQPPSEMKTEAALVSIHSSIRALCAAEWNALADSNAFASHGWLLSMEGAWRADCRPLYFALRRSGRLQAVAVCYVMRPSPSVETLDDLMLGRLAGPAARLGLSFLPALVCGPALGYGWHIGVSQELDPPDRRQRLEEVLAAIEQEADRLGLFLSFAQVLDEEVELRRLLAGRGYLTSRNVPIASLDVQWSSMDEYFRSLPRRHRKTFRRESRRNVDAGVTIQTQESCSGLEGRLLGLLDNNAQAHGGLHCPFRSQVFLELETSMGDDALWFVARKEGAIIGVLLALRHESGIAAFAVGVDNDTTKGDFTYFQLCYYGLIDYAIRHGIKRIDYGRGMYPIKVRRGCRLSGASLYTRMKGRHRTLVSLWYCVASFWNRYKLSPSLRRRIGSPWRP